MSEYGSGLRPDSGFGGIRGPQATRYFRSRLMDARRIPQPGRVRTSIRAAVLTRHDHSTRRVIRHHPPSSATRQNIEYENSSSGSLSRPVPPRAPGRAADKEEARVTDDSGNLGAQGHPVKALSVYHGSSSRPISRECRLQELDLCPPATRGGCADHCATTTGEGGSGMALSLPLS